MPSEETAISDKNINFEITAGMIKVEDFEMDDPDGNSFSCYLGAYFDVFKKFGIKKEVPDDSTYVNVYGVFYPIDKKIIVQYTICFEEDKPDETYKYIPTLKEADVIFNAMDNFCVKEFYMPMQSLIFDMTRKSAMEQIKNKLADIGWIMDMSSSDFPMDISLNYANNPETFLKLWKVKSCDDFVVRLNNNYSNPLKQELGIDDYEEFFKIIKNIIKENRYKDRLAGEIGDWFGDYIGKYEILTGDKTYKYQSAEALFAEWVDKMVEDYINTGEEWRKEIDYILDDVGVIIRNPELRRKYEDIKSKADIKAVENNKPIINDFGKELQREMAQRHNLLVYQNGRFEGTEILFPYIKSVENAAAWYLFTYGEYALDIMEEQFHDIPEGYENNSCFGFRFKDVHDFINNKCINQNIELDYNKQKNEDSLMAYIEQEIPFRLEEVYEIPLTQHVKEHLVQFIKDDTDSLFNYDVLDNKLLNELKNVLKSQFQSCDDVTAHLCEVLNIYGDADDSIKITDKFRPVFESDNYYCINYKDDNDYYLVSRETGNYFIISSDTSPFFHLDNLNLIQNDNIIDIYNRSLYIELIEISKGVVVDQFKKEYISGILVLEKGLEEYDRKNYNLDNKIKSAAVKVKPLLKRKNSAELDK